MVHLCIRTEHDEREYISVVEIYEVDEEDREITNEAATAACAGLTTCGDVADRYQMLRNMVEQNLKGANVPYDFLEIDDE